ncbi:MAG: hypothetical protein M3070_16175 [Actinomycetota bacterium]|nr:hypothetical protein [Actinomycetota bacterium]
MTTRLSPGPAAVARLGKPDSAVVEESLRRDLKRDVLEDLWKGVTLSEDQAEALAVEAQHATRRG